MIFFVMCSVAGVIFLQCLIPCLIRLIHSVVQGMQIVVIPEDPELASRNKISKIKSLGEGGHESKTAEILAKFEKRIRNDGNGYNLYQGVP